MLANQTASAGATLAFSKCPLLLAEGRRGKGKCGTGRGSKVRRRVCGAPEVFLFYDPTSSVQTHRTDPSIRRALCFGSRRLRWSTPTTAAATPSQILATARGRSAERWVRGTGDPSGSVPVPFFCSSPCNCTHSGPKDGRKSPSKANVRTASGISQAPPEIFLGF